MSRTSSVLLEGRDDTRYTSSCASYPMLAWRRLGAANARVDTSTPVGQAIVRMYNFDFPGAHAILDRQIAEDPQIPLAHSVKAAAYLFGELDRLKILQMDFFRTTTESSTATSSSRTRPSARRSSRQIEKSRELANRRLATHPDDRDALFTLCMSAGLVTDYAALVERRRLASFALAKQTPGLRAQVVGSGSAVLRRAPDVGIGGVRRWQSLFLRPVVRPYRRDPGQQAEGD